MFNMFRKSIKKLSIDLKRGMTIPTIFEEDEIEGGDDESESPNKKSTKSLKKVESNPSMTKGLANKLVNKSQPKINNTFKTSVDDYKILHKPTKFPSAVHQINKRYSIKLKPLNPKAIRSKSYSVPVSTSPAPVALPTLVNSNSQSSIDSVNQNCAVISNIISACNDYGTEEMIPIDKKIAYKVFLENYNQKIFNKTVEIANAMHEVEAKYVKQYYDYQIYRTQEERLTTYEITNQYKRECMNPRRAVALIEKRKKKKLKHSFTS